MARTINKVSELPQSGWYFPDFGQDSASASFIPRHEGLFGAYKRVNERFFDALRRVWPARKP